jgi:hypothetical protein
VHRTLFQASGFTALALVCTDLSGDAQRECKLDEPTVEIEVDVASKECPAAGCSLDDKLLDSGISKSDGRYQPRHGKMS